MRSSQAAMLVLPMAGIKKNYKHGVSVKSNSVNANVSWNTSPELNLFLRVDKHTEVQDDTEKRELLKTPTKIEEIQEKKIIDRNWTITTCLLRDNNPSYQCLKITSCRWRPPPRMHSFTATTKLKLKLNSVASARERTIPTERPPPVGEVSANFSG